MNIAVKCALASAVIVVLVHACATPVEIGDDVLLANPNDFGDAGLLGGAAGDVGQGGASSGGSSGSVGGTGAATAGAGTGGAGLTGMPVGLAGGGGLPGTSGAGGSLGAGAGGSPAVGGSGGSGGTGAGAAGTPSTAGSGGTGGTGSAAVFDPSACDFSDTTGCEALTCQAACPTNDGNSCRGRCEPVVDCVVDALDATPGEPCVTEDDPLCGGRDGGTPRECTGLVDSAGGLNASGANEPAFVARRFVECICSVPRP